MQDSISLEANEPYFNTVQRILVDSVEQRNGETVYTGKTETNKPVHFTAKSAEVGEFINVKINKCGAFELYGSEDKEK